MSSPSAPSVPVTLKLKNDSTEEFAYMPPPRSSFSPKEEGLKEKLVRKTKENPFVPLGVLLTTYALGRGLWNMRLGDMKRSQKMMRLRIVGQGFTIVAMLGGVLAASKYSGQKKAE